MTNPRSDISGSFPPLSPTEAPLHTGRDGFSDVRLQTLANWTSVSKDSQFLALLMNLWYKWDYTYYHFLDWDIFLDDLSSGATDFCSELLVNAILACASVSSSGFHICEASIRTKCKDRRFEHHRHFYFVYSTKILCASFLSDINVHWSFD